jgi:hypothetical protein
VNLVVVGGVIDPEDTGDREERAECEKMHGLVEKYNLKVGRLCSLRHSPKAQTLLFSIIVCIALT